MIIVPVEKKVDWKRPPLVLISIVLLNILIFVFYQSSDNFALGDAVGVYEDKGLVSQEWAAFKAYSRRNDLPYEFDQNDPEAAWYIVADGRFDRFMRKNHRHYIAPEDYSRWRAARDRVEDISSTMSARAAGLDTAEITPFTLISHQFLHGGVMHLVGNMVFLILTGFAVEAALGSLRFLGFYLLSGVGSGLLFALLDPSAGTLVGASGAISGVMAMYVVVFGLRKIQFFYWIFVFTGYIRAAAIIMLPFYIGFELYKYFSDDGSNVAYTAHIGGFITGAALVFITQSINKSGIDETYVEAKPKEVDPFAQALTKLYALVAHCEFKRAWEVLKQLKAKYPNKTVLVEIEYNLVRALHPQKLNDYLLHRMDKPGNTRPLIHAQLKALEAYSEEKSTSLSHEKKRSLFENALLVGSLKAAENLFRLLRNEEEDPLAVAVLARQISVYCQNNDLQDKRSEYSELANRLAQSDVNRISRVGDRVQEKPRGAF